jgi:WD40 repeat protein
MSPRSLTRTLSLCSALLLRAAHGLAQSPAEPANEPAPPVPQQVSFSKEIAPILLKRCVGCHGPSEPKGEYRLHSYEALLKPGASGEPSITAGKPDQSELYRLISSSDADERMPREGDPLTIDQIALIKRWIEQEAHFDGPDKLTPLAALVPKKLHPAPPDSYRVPIPVTALAFRPDGKELAVGGYHEVTIWDPATGALLRRIENVEQRTLDLEYSKDGMLLAVAGGTPGQSGEVSLFNPAEGTLVATLGQLSDVAFGVAFDPTGDRLAACSADRTIQIYDLKSRTAQSPIEDHADWVLGIAWNPDGTQLASASRDKTSKVFDAKTGESLATYSGHAETVFAVAFAADGKSVYSAGGDKRIHVWSAATAKPTATLGGSSGGVGGELLAMALVGERLFSGSADRTAREYKVADLTLAKSFGGHKDYIYGLSYSEPAKRLATGSFDGEVRIWNVDDGQPVLTFYAAPGYPSAQTLP